MANFNIAYLIELKDKYTQVARKVAESTQKIHETVARLDGQLGNFSGNLDKVSGNFKKIREAGQAAFIGYSVPIGLAIGGVVKLGAELEDTRIGMTTMLGSADKANKLVASIRKMGAETPFESGDLLRNSKMLLNFGIAYKDVMPTMKMLGDLSGGNVERFNQLTYAFSQMSAQGKLMGGDLMQMTNAGFSPLQVLAKKTGKTMGELRDIMSKGGITSQMVIQAMQIETSKGGKFYQYMAKNSQTFNGLMSSLSDNIKMVAADVGEKLLPNIKPLVVALIGMTSVLGKLSPSTITFGLGIAGVTALIPVLMVTIGFLGEAFISYSKTITMIGQGFTKLSLLMSEWNVVAKISTAVNAVLNSTLWANPILWIVIAVVALIAVLVLAYQKCSLFRQAVNLAWSYIKLLGMSIYAWALPAIQGLGRVLAVCWNWIKKVAHAVGSLWTMFMKSSAVQWIIQKFDLLIEKAMKLKAVMSGKFSGWQKDVDAQIADKDKQINAQQASGKSTNDVNIHVKAEQGTEVTKTSSKGKGASKVKLGGNAGKKGGK